MRFSFISMLARLPCHRPVLTGTQVAPIFRLRSQVSGGSVNAHLWSARPGPLTQPPGPRSAGAAQPAAQAHGSPGLARAPAEATCPAVSANSCIGSSKIQVMPPPPRSPPHFPSLGCSLVDRAACSESPVIRSRKCRHLHKARSPGVNLGSGLQHPQSLLAATWPAPPLHLQETQGPNLPVGQLQVPNPQKVRDSKRGYVRPGSGCLFPGNRQLCTSSASCDPGATHRPALPAGSRLEADCWPRSCSPDPLRSCPGTFSCIQRSGATGPELPGPSHHLFCSPAWLQPLSLGPTAEPPPGGPQARATRSLSTFPT